MGVTCRPPGIRHSVLYKLQVHDAKGEKHTRLLHQENRQSMRHCANSLFYLVRSHLVISRRVRFEMR